MFDESFSSALEYMSQPYSEAMVMRPARTYTPCDVSLRGETGDIIKFAQFEEVGILTKIRNDAESGDKSDNKLIMTMDSGDESDHYLISKEMLEDICGRSQTHPNVNRIEARYKIRDCINQRQSEWKGSLKATRRMGKCLHKVFKTFVKTIARIDTFGRIWFRSFPFHSRT